MVGIAREGHIHCYHIRGPIKSPRTVGLSPFLENSGFRNKPVAGRVNSTIKANGEAGSLNFNFGRHRGTITEMNQKHPLETFFTVTVQMTGDKNC